jgi:Caspase domain/Restriction endonuclease
MTRKPVVTRTFAPIHFEDLDPHRFEDLIRELIYDFRDWRSIEATGRAGSDDGFDIRAYEKPAAQDQPDDQDEETEPLHPMDGPRWMIQGKREKTLTPSAVKKILTDVDASDPPYGYILAASAVFSKASYDLFREELRKKGVMEFYLWGRSELEDMLHLPKNDRILFTFFGISLVSRRRSRATEVRASVTTKNKLYRVLGDPQSMIEKNVLLRDINDVHYPYKDEHPAFDKQPSWIERVVGRHHPRGLLIRHREFYAFVDRDKKEWDFTDHTDSLFSKRDVLSEAERKEHWKTQKEVRDIWKFLPRARQATFEIEALLNYSDILIVDPNGDERYGYPHLYTDFKGTKGPYDSFYETLSVRGEEIDLDESWRQQAAIADFVSAVKLGDGEGVYFGKLRQLVGYDEILELLGMAKQTASVVGSEPPASSRPAPAPALLPLLGRRVALVLGNSSYMNVNLLPNPLRDADAVAASLRNVGFQTVTIRDDLTHSQMIGALNDFSDQAANADWALIYFSGHGLELGGTNYVVPVDAKLLADRDVQDETVSLDRLLAATMGARKLHIVILDACRDNPFLPKMRQTVATRSVGRGLARIEPEGATLVVYAARDGQIAYDGDGQNSPFVTALTKRMGEPNLEINKLFRLVHDDVLAATGRRQEPYVYGALPGDDFYFLQK